MRLSIPLILCLAFPAWGGDSLEEAVERASAAAAEARKKEAKRRVFPLGLVEAGPAAAALPLLLDARLDDLRDGMLDVVSAEVGGRSWKVGMAPDEGYDDFFIVLSAGADRLVAPLAPLGRFLSSEGVVVSDEEGPVLRLNARISLLHPINGTTIVAVDAGKPGDKDSFTVGELIAALGEKGKAFRAGKTDFVVLMGREVLNGGAVLADEETIFIARNDGARSKGWAVRESALAAGAPASVSAGGRILSLEKTADGRLLVRDAGPAPKN
jgi:hypothetical protein